MKYAGILKNDIADSITGLTVSFWTQGCPHHCPGCHNPQTWDFNGGIEKPIDTIVSEIIDLISKNNVIRNFSVLGGEPLCKENIKSVAEIISRIRAVYPDIDIYLWTGYEYSELNKQDKYLKIILSNINYLIDGKFDINTRDTTLILRGSPNQHVIEITPSKSSKIIKEMLKNEQRR